MSVPKVFKSYECLRRVIKFFEMSTKRKDKLNEAMTILEMNHLKLLSWCVNRMTHFVTSAINLLNSFQLLIILFTIMILKERSRRPIHR